MFKSKNFTTAEIAHKSLPHNNDEFWLECAASFQMGYIQAIRDYLSFEFKKDMPIRITSGYRTPDYNQAVGGVPSSYHIWRLAEGMQFVTATDCGFSGVDLEEIFKALDPFGGEIILEQSKGIIHISPYGKRDHLIQK